MTQKRVNGGLKRVYGDPKWCLGKRGQIGFLGWGTQGVVVLLLLLFAPRCNSMVKSKLLA